MNTRLIIESYEVDTMSAHLTDEDTEDWVAVIYQGIKS